MSEYDDMIGAIDDLVYGLREARKVCNTYGVKRSLDPYVTLRRLRRQADKLKAQGADQ